MSTDIAISIRNLYKVFGRNPAKAMEKVHQGMGKDELLEKTGHVIGLNNVNLDMERHRIQVVMGLSGSGKSTLIRHINRLIAPTEGEILVDGEDVIKLDQQALRDLRRFKISMVFQKFALFPHRTILENVGYGLENQGMAREKILETSRQWIERVGLNGFEDHYPQQLSGGMQQRVGLARALATDAEILLMDEAFSALDPLIRTEMQNVMLELQNELQKTIVFITHDLDEALRIGDTIAILRDGVIVQNDDPQNILMSPADTYVASFMKDINRARVLRVRAIMNKPQETDSGPVIKPNTTIETALQIFAESSSDHLIVADRSGTRVGRLTVEDLIRGMRRPSQSEIQAQQAVT
ncbi:quaternary amine ABC transporter ATP-binding protein [Orrella marina]|uniref:Quaternary amine transport ATP-binding protein n=1 Tax=Orrella marina TaxID=2163011 RepID=A0A2R4XP20_9BURK|nr:glycine betaine/L-proline ABC transporter ATP-binding protein [Orrella marina]AWB35439.1 glycine/betaine ABC transporter [Orrella marina]